jgi:hypothetical protein
MRQYKKPDPRIFQLNLSLTAAELGSIKHRAEELGLRPVHFARIAALEEKSELGPSPSANGTRKIHLQLIRLGNNLNQLVRELHQNNVPLPSDLEPLLKDIRLLIARISE